MSSAMIRTMLGREGLRSAATRAPVTRKSRKAVQKFFTEEYFQSTMVSDKDAREERQLQVSRSVTMLMILFVGERQMAARSKAANGSTSRRAGKPLAGEAV